MRAATAIASTVFSVSCLAGEPQAMFYLMIPFGQPPQLGLMLRSTDTMRPLPVLDFRLSYRPKAEGDASAAADAASTPNWWLIGGAVAVGAIVIANQSKSRKTEEQPCTRIGGCL
jgi:hypothetical protein